MKQIIDVDKFIDAFQRMNRADNFSYAGKEALFQYLEEMNPDMIIDVVALCCTYAEYASIEEYADAYGLPYDVCPHCDEKLPEAGRECAGCNESTIDRETIIQHIQKHTVFIPIDTDSFIIIDY